MKYPTSCPQGHNFDAYNTIRYSSGYRLCRTCRSLRRNLAHGKTRKFINSYKDNPCVDCGVKYPPYVMQFDHIDMTTKLFNVGEKTSLSMEKLLVEIEKCEVICANCHAERTHRRGSH